jgi:two-component system chemotaxis response regulator CheY
MGGSKMNILIVDDNEVGCRLLEIQLSDYGTSVTVNDGTEAIRAFKDALEAGEGFDLICMDYVMPKMDGLEVFNTIRQIESEHQITKKDSVRIIMISAVSCEADIMKAHANGCDSYIIRPYKKEALFDEIHNVGLSTQANT